MLCDEKFVWNSDKSRYVTIVRFFPNLAGEVVFKVSNKDKLNKYILFMRFPFVYILLYVNCINMFKVLQNVNKMKSHETMSLFNLSFLLISTSIVNECMDANRMNVGDVAPLTNSWNDGNRE